MRNRYLHDKDYLPHIDRRVENVITHPEYNNTTDGITLYDVSLLKLSEPIEYSLSVIPICLPQDDNFLVNEIAWTQGLGDVKTCKSFGIYAVMDIHLHTTIE